MNEPFILTTAQSAIYLRANFGFVSSLISVKLGEGKYKSLNSRSSINYPRVAFGLCLKTRLRAKPFIGQSLHTYENAFGLRVHRLANQAHFLMSIY